MIATTDAHNRYRRARNGTRGQTTKASRVVIARYEWRRIMRRAALPLREPKAAAPRRRATRVTKRS